jgi:hypothetical protein
MITGIPGRVIALEAPQQFDAAAAGQHPVQEHDVRALVHDQGVRILYVVRLQAAKSTISRAMRSMSRIANSSSTTSTVRSLMTNIPAVVRGAGAWCSEHVTQR